ncbi:MAG: 3-dehydroquinate synthase [Puniceicoccales bacterium]|nr:3-dehydroquinate synthase [Puniceicoccales bacterium]
MTCNNSTISVSLGARAYPIHIGAGVREVFLGALDRLRGGGRAVFVVTSPAVVRAQALLFEGIRAVGAVVHVVSCDGEGAKRAVELEALWEALAVGCVDRGGVVVAVGGGVVGDLSGFAAATYLRGVDFIQVPTTLLAMVDSAVGGKTGINLGAGKNLAGAFHQPVAVYADTGLLATLPPREFSAGMAEVIKTGLLGDAALFARLCGAGPLRWDHPALEGVIRRCCEIKAVVVGADERETAGGEGGRALLNLGHTFGHAIENVAGYGEYLHGEAVAVGLVLAARLSVELGLVGRDVVASVAGVLRANNLPLALRRELPVGALLEAMRRDKKARGGAMRFVVLRAVGEAGMCLVDDEVLLARVLGAAHLEPVFFA